MLELEMNISSPHATIHPSSGHVNPSLQLGSNEQLRVIGLPIMWSMEQRSERKLSRMSQGLSLEVG